MNAVRDRVRVVLTQDRADPFELQDGDVTELESRVASADRGELVPAAHILEKLRRTR